MTGTSFGDYITPSNNVAESIYGGGGNDTIEYESSHYNDDTGEWEYYLPKADTIYGGTGNDSIYYTDHNDAGVRAYGEDGDDEIYISAGAAWGGKGQDSIYAAYDNPRHEYHNVTIYGFSSTYEDEADDGSVGDYIYSDDGNDYIQGSKGNDTISAGSGNDIIKAGSGDDTIKAGNGDDYIEGGNGDDVIYTNWDASHYSTYEEYTGYSGSGNETVDAGAGDDTILVQGDAHTITGGKGDDLIVSSYGSSSDYHFKSGDGNDTLYTSTSSGYYDKVFFDDLIFDGENVKAEYYHDATNGYPANTLVIFYDKNGSSWGSSIQVRNYISEDRLEYMSDVNSNLHTLIDKNGNVIYIRDLLNGRTSNIESTDDTIGTIFNDTVTLDNNDALYAFSGNYGNDSITGNDYNNNLFGYEYGGYHGWGVVGDGNDYLDGKNGYNQLYGGWGNDTLVGGYDGKTDTMHGGYGANTYVIKIGNTDIHNATVAEIHSASDKDTINIERAQSVYFAKDSDNLTIAYQSNGSYSPNMVTIYNWFDNPRDFVFNTYNKQSYLFDTLKQKNFNDGVEFGESTTLVDFDTQNTSDEKIYLGTSGDDRMYVRYGTIVSGGYGNDSIQAYYAPSTIYGGEGNDTLLGSTDADSIYGGGGIDSIEAGGGDDLIYTASPSEFIYNWDPATSTSYYRMFEQYVRPDSTDDWDSVLAGEGNDTIYAIGENSNLYGGDGDDTYHVTLNNRTYISDTSGTNNIVLHTFQESGGESTYLVMDVNNAHNFNGEYGVLLLDYDGYHYWLNNACDLSGYKGGYVELSPLKVGGQNGTYTHQNIGTITEIGNSSVTGDQINELKSNIQNWFTSVHYAYSSVSDALTNGTDEHKAELLAYFTDFNNNAWQ